MMSEVLERIPLLGRLFRRCFIDGFDHGIRDAAMSVDLLLNTYTDPGIPRAAVKELAARLYAELEDTP